MMKNGRKKLRQLPPLILALADVYIRCLQTAFGQDTYGKGFVEDAVQLAERHYALIVVDGRQDGYSEGMTYIELAQMCEQMGLSVAYNLDGGGSTRMVFRGQTVDCPSEERDLTDIVLAADVY